MKAQQEILQRISAKLNMDKEQREVQDEQRKTKEEKLEMLIRAFRAQERRKKAKEREEDSRGTSSDRFLPARKGEFTGDTRV